MSKSVPNLIEVSRREEFVFNFIGNHDGKAIPEPLPETVLSLQTKGLVELGDRLPVDGVAQMMTRCFLTELGKVCFIKRKG